MASTRNHDFRRLDDGQCIIPATQFERAHGIGGDDGGQRLVADAHADLGEQAIDADFIDETVQAVSGAQAVQRLVGIRDTAASPGVRLLPCEQTVDFVIRNAMMPALGAAGSHMSGMNPSFQRRVRDAEPLGRRSHGMERHRLESYHCESIRCIDSANP